MGNLAHVVDDRGEAGLASVQLESLQRITAAFSTALTPEEVTEQLVRHSSTSTDADAIWVVLADESGAELVTAAAQGYGPEFSEWFERLSVDASVPLAESVRRDRPLWYPDADDLFTEFPRFAEVAPKTSSVAVVPLNVAGEHIGAVVLCFPEKRDFSASDRNYLLTLARVCGHALRRARQYGREHATAVALQRGLLPEVPEVAGAQACARYRPASAGAQVGGDWYDLMPPLPYERVGIVVGDVAGHHMDAAAVMGQMRSALRALALSEEDPGPVMTRLNTLAYEFPGTALTTVFYGVWDPPGILRYVSAGHLPPLVKAADGSVRRLYSDPPALPVNTTRSAVYDTVQGVLHPGETLVAYTDGLVERRGENLDAGLARLTRVLENARDDIDDLCDRLLEAADPEREDDIALLVFRPHGHTPDSAR